MITINSENQNAAREYAILIDSLSFKFLKGSSRTATDNKGILSQVTREEINQMAALPPKILLNHFEQNGKLVTTKQYVEELKSKLSCFYSTNASGRKLADAIAADAQGVLVIDIDSGNYDLSQIKTILERLHVTNYTIWSTIKHKMHFASKDDPDLLQPLGNRWRLCIWLKEPLSVNTWQQAVRYFNAVFEGSDKAMERPNQASYLPVDVGTNSYQYHIEDGQPLDMSDDTKPVAQAYKNFCAANPPPEPQKTELECSAPADFGACESKAIEGSFGKLKLPMEVNVFDSPMQPLAWLKAQDINEVALVYGYEFACKNCDGSLRYSKPNSNSAPGACTKSNRMVSMHENDIINTIGAPNIKGKSCVDLVFAHGWGNDTAESRRELANQLSAAMVKVGQVVAADIKTIDEKENPKAQITELAKKQVSVLRNNKFPVDSLGPILAGAVREIAEKLEVESELPGQAILGVTSTLCQRHYNVKLHHAAEPTSLFMHTFAASGERKSAVMNLINRPVLDWDELNADSEVKRAFKAIAIKHFEYYGMISRFLMVS